MVSESLVGLDKVARAERTGGVDRMRRSPARPPATVLAQSVGHCRCDRDPDQLAATECPVREPLVRTSPALTCKAAGPAKPAIAIRKLKRGPLAAHLPLASVPLAPQALLERAPTRIHHLFVR